MATVRTVVVEEADLVDGGLLMWDATNNKFKKPTAAVHLADVAAITGGESPTEAEHNALITRVNALTAILQGVKLIAAS